MPARMAVPEISNLLSYLMVFVSGAFSSGLVRPRARHVGWVRVARSEGFAALAHRVAISALWRGCRQRVWGQQKLPAAFGREAFVSIWAQRAFTNGAASSPCRSIWRGNASRGRAGSSAVARAGRVRATRRAASSMRAVFHSPPMIALRSLFSFHGALSMPDSRVGVWVGKKAQKKSCFLASCVEG
jgi:hypothetical protein